MISLTAVALASSARNEASVALAEATRLSTSATSCVTSWALPRFTGRAAITERAATLDAGRPERLPSWDP
jgi:hypothetical protein